jgi:fructose-1,6-bisphosphatase/inositol monophosphatase family enzyme
MQDKAKEYIDILISLEPVFKKAGELSLKMRSTAGSKNKFSTGVAGIDIVTETDTAVQEFILSEMVKTKLVECELIAEEDTALAKKFNGTNGLVLTLDPIDGTLLYANGKNFFLTIVSLHDDKNLLYTFLNYPVFNWSRRITDKVEDFGKKPEIKTNPKIDLSKTISYTVRPPKIIDQNIYQTLIGEGYKFVKASEITDEAGSTTLFSLGKTAGYYMETPNPYDGLVDLHYAKTKDFKIYAYVDFSKTHPTDHGPHYHGWYVVIRK